MNSTHTKDLSDPQISFCHNGSYDKNLSLTANCFIIVVLLYNNCMLHFLFFSFFFFFCFLVPQVQHMKFPRLGVKSELHLLAYATATATQDLSHVGDLHYSSWQCQILNPMSEARDRTHVLMDTSQAHYPLSHNRNSRVCFLSKLVQPYCF